MTPAIASALTPLLRLIDAETAHGLALHALRAGLAGGDPAPDDPRLAMTLFGRTLRNPIGLAAGFDKNAVALRPLARLGFGALEAGTVTPRPQQGNPRPRMFRLGEDRAVINRLGFNNAGLDAYLARFADRPRDVLVGANVGINKDATDPERDYATLVEAVARMADYIVVNVSSPNTPGLRDLQAETRLRSILGAIAQAVPQRPPLLVKLAPDLAEAAVEAAVEAAIAGGAQGLIVSNTTIARPASLRSAHRHQPGGLSGAPLLAQSTALLARVAKLARGRLELVGVGGVASGADVLAKLMAGATLVQLYTAFAYAGPALIGRLKRELLAALDAHGFATAADAVGQGVR
jgi:dihydroorotate dehydrogenase